LRTLDEIHFAILIGFLVSNDMILYVQVCEVADICCDGRVVSVLEGGYGRTPPPVPAPPVFAGDPAVEAVAEPVKQKLDKSFFSECAIQHLKGLVDPYYNAEGEQQKDPPNRKCD